MDQQAFNFGFCLAFAKHGVAPTVKSAGVTDVVGKGFGALGALLDRAGLSNARDLGKYGLIAMAAGGAGIGAGTAYLRDALTAPDEYDVNDAIKNVEIAALQRQSDAADNRIRMRDLYENAGN